MKRKHVKALVSAAILFAATAVCPAALFFDGANDYVTFGAAPGLGVTNFTIECWFRREGVGDTTSSGSSGITNGVPLVAKGRAQVDGDNRDLNYFLGLSGNVLAADFEDRSTGANHPVFGTALIASNVWQHAAVTYDQPSGRWVLYLNGVPDVTNTVSGSALVRTPRGDSIQHAALASALQSSGAADGFFNGTMDEIRIWNIVRSAGEIAASYNLRVTNATGLIARWGLNQNSGSVASNSVPGGINGTLTNGPLWTTGYPFAGQNNPPFAPVANSPTNGATGVSTSPALSVVVSDPDTNNLTVTFHGRTAIPQPADFTMVLLPDTQRYVSSIGGGLPAMFTSQTDWIVANRSNRNIQYVGHVGDCVENGNNVAEWQHVTNALYRLENPVTTSLSNGIPYGAAVGNHDQTPNGSPTGPTTFYNQYFGSAHFQSYSYYGGHFSTNNDNHYDLFSAGGMDFVVVYFEYNSGANTNDAVFAWANGVLQTHNNRRAIVVSHYILDEGFNALFGNQGAAIYNALKGNTNLFLMLCGHQHDTTGEGQRTNTFNGRTVWTVMSDYQDRTGGGNGLLRLYEFSPGNNVIRVKTYSPWLNQFETDSDSQFEIPHQMTAPNPFTAIATNSGVASGAMTSTVWPGLAPNTAYEYYVTVSDGSLTTNSPIWQFTTGNLTTNAPPIASAATLQFAGDTATNFNLVASDPDGDPMTFVLESLPVHGLLSGLNPTNGNVTYTPAHGYSGPDNFGFFASDEQTNSAVATISIDVQPPFDANSDGIPDAWATLHGVTDPGADADGDGMNNRQEYIAGTNPTNAGSALRITGVVRLTNGHCIITWAAVGGTRYRVSFSDDLEDPFTSIVRSIEDEMNPAPLNAESTQSFTDDFSLTGGSTLEGGRYYRIEVVQ